MRNLIFGILSIAGLVSFGCGGQSAPSTVHGQVRLDGVPLAGAKVEFFPVGGGNSSVALTDAGGNYSLVQSAEVSGAEPGNYTVSISKFEQRPVPGGEPDEMQEFAILPAVYNEESTIQRTLVKGTNELNFSLTSSGTPVPDESSKQ